MMQTEYAQQDSLANRLNIVDALVKQATKAEIESISAVYLIQANQEINLLELKYSSELTIQQNLYKVKRSSPKCWCKLNSANLSFHKLKHTGFF